MLKRAEYLKTSDSFNAQWMSILDRKLSLDKLIYLLIGHQWLQGISLHLLIIIFNFPILIFMKKTNWIFYKKWQGH